MPDGSTGLLEATQFGSDGLRYQRLDVEAQLARFHAPTYFSAHTAGELAGIYVVDKRDLLMDEKPVQGFYRGALAVAEQFQGGGIGKLLTTEAMQWMDNQSRHSNAFSYGCIDASNQRSLQVLNRHGANPMGSLCMYMMYRQWQRAPIDLIRLRNDDWSDDALVRQVYGNHALRDITPSNLDGFSLMDNQGVAISARVAPSAFRICSMGAAAEWLTRLMVTPWPPARARFNTERFRYVSFSQLLIRPGSESLWPEFVSSVLAHYHCHFGAVYVDTQTRLYTILRQMQGAPRWLYRPAATIHIVGRAVPVAQQAPVARDVFAKPVVLWPVDA